VLGEGGTAKLTKRIGEIAMKSIAPFVTPLYQNSIETRKTQLRAENPKLWEQVEGQINQRIDRIRASGFQPVPQDVDDAYDSTIGKLTRSGKLTPKAREPRELIGEVRHAQTTGTRPVKKTVITSEIKAEAVRMGVSEESAAEILEHRKKLREAKK